MDASTEQLLRSEDRFLSSISILEIATKVRVGKLDLPEPMLESAIEDLAIEVLPYDAKHARQLYTLPTVKDHRDPFDRALIATAIAAGMTLITTDGEFHPYRQCGLKLVEAR